MQDWGNDTAQRKSRSRYLFTLGTGAISYRSRQQTRVAQSTCKAENYSAADATREAIHIRQLLGEIQGVPVSDTTTICEDNQSTIAYSQNALAGDKTKHISLKYYLFVKDHIAHGTIHLMYLPTSEMVAETLTKPLPGSALSKHTSVMLGATRQMDRHIP
jgi:hypothetical protein